MSEKTIGHESAKSHAATPAERAPAEPVYEIELRQKLTSLVKLHRPDSPAGTLIMDIHHVLRGDYDPRPKVRALRTLEPGHVGADGVMVPMEAEED